MAKSNEFKSNELMTSLAALMEPRSIAVIGASSDRRKNSGKPLNFLKEHDYRGEVFPINPRYQELLGWPCYPSVEAVPRPIDTAVIALPADAVGKALEECGRKGVRSAVILTSGFSEVGGDGHRLERELVEIAERYGIRFCGPNSVGVINAHTGAISSFSQAADGKTLQPGAMALVSQSGNFGTFMIELAARRGIAFSHFVSTGNEANLSFLDFAEYLVADEKVGAVVGYVEGLRDSARLRDIGLRARARRTPIILVKVGRSEAAARSAKSHTGAIVGNDALYDTAFTQAGIIRADHEEEVLDALPLLMGGRLPAGPRVGIVSISGGGATIMADACAAEGLTMPEFVPATQDKLRQVVPYFGMVANPVDLTGQVLAEAGLMQLCLQAVLDDPNIDSVVVFLSLMERMGEQVANEILEAVATASKPVVISWVAGPAQTIAKLRARGLCVTTAPTIACARTLGHGWRYAQWLNQAAAPAASPEAESTTAVAGHGDVLPLSGLESRKLLGGLGLPVLPHRCATTATEAVTAAQALGFPVTLKLEQPVLAHKTEWGAVRLNLTDPAQVQRHAGELLDLGASLAKGQRPSVLVEAMAPPGIEMLLSLQRDAQFGYTLNAGIGGVNAEIYGDVATRILPVDADEIRAMLRSLRGYRLLQGYRGRPPADIEAVVAALSRLAALPQHHPGLSEVEINPFMVYGVGAGGALLDALIYAEPAR